MQTRVNIKGTTKKEDKVFHKIGNWYKHANRTELWILSCIEGKLVLVGTNGSFWTTPVPYKMPKHDITNGRIMCVFDEDFDAACAYTQFELVKNITITED